MSTFLKLLPLELEQLEGKQYLEPPVAVSDNETVVGEVGDYARRLFTLWRMKERAAREHQVAAEFTTDKAEAVRLMRMRHECIMKAKAISCLFWIAVRDEFELWGVSHVGINEGWKVTCCDTDSDTHITLNDIIRRMFDADADGD